MACPGKEPGENTGHYYYFTKYSSVWAPISHFTNAPSCHLRFNWKHMAILCTTVRNSARNVIELCPRSSLFEPGQKGKEIWTRSIHYGAPEMTTKKNLLEHLCNHFGQFICQIPTDFRQKLTVHLVSHMKFVSSSKTGLQGDGWHHETKLTSYLLRSSGNTTLERVLGVEEICLGKFTVSNRYSGNILGNHNQTFNGDNSI